MDQPQAPQFIVTVLGSGTCVPLASRFPPSFFVQPAASSGGWLLDIGAGALQRLAQVDEEHYQSLDSVFVSHPHPDHIAGLPPLLQALKYTPGLERTKPLFVYGPDTVKQYLDLHLDFAPSLRPSFPLDFVVLADKREISRDSLHVVGREMKHSRATTTIGFRFTLGGCALVYGADTEPCDAIIELAADADLLILESSFPKEQPEPGHLTTLQAGEIAQASRAKRLLLTHFYPQVAAMSDEERRAQVSASGFAGEVFLAQDGMVVEVPSGRVKLLWEHDAAPRQVRNRKVHRQGRTPRTRGTRTR